MYKKHIKGGQIKIQQTHSQQLKNFKKCFFVFPSKNRQKWQMLKKIALQNTTFRTTFFTFLHHKIIAKNSQNTTIIFSIHHTTRATTTMQKSPQSNQPAPPTKKPRKRQLNSIHEAFTNIPTNPHHLNHSTEKTQKKSEKPPLQTPLFHTINNPINRTSPKSS